MAEDKKSPQNNNPKQNDRVAPKAQIRISGEFKGSEGRTEKSFSPRPPLPPKK